MIIKMLLTLALLGSLLYFWFHRAQLRTLSFLIGLGLVAGIYLVWVPDHATVLARWMGVGRGADLVLYGWVTVSFAVILVQHVRERRMMVLLTGIVRAMAVAAPHQPEKPVAATQLGTEPGSASRG